MKVEMLYVDDLRSGLVKDFLKQPFHLGVAVAVPKGSKMTIVNCLEVRDPLELAS